MTISVTRIALAGIAGIALGGCGYPDFGNPQALRTVQPPATVVQPAPVVASSAASVPAEIEEEQKRTWTTGHVPTGKTHTGTGNSGGAPSGGDEDGGWG